jgi:hypothetical protein
MPLSEAKSFDLVATRPPMLFGDIPFNGFSKSGVEILSCTPTEFALQLEASIA